MELNNTENLDMRVEINGKDNLYIILAKDIYTQNDLDKMRSLLYSFDWDNDKFIMLPSEYIEKIEVIER